MRVLFVDDDESYLQTQTELLTRARYEVRPCGGEKEAHEFIENQGGSVDIALLDMKMERDDSGLRLICLLRRLHPHVLPIVLTGYPDFVNAAKCMEAGAFSYVCKIDAVEMLLPTLARAVERIQDSQRARRIGADVADMLTALREALNALERLMALLQRSKTQLDELGQHARSTKPDAD